jgi:hypothetical protein
MNKTERLSIRLELKQKTYLKHRAKTLAKRRGKNQVSMAEAVADLIDMHMAMDKKLKELKEKEG